MVIGDDKVRAAAGPDVFGPAVDEAGLEEPVEAQAVGEPSFEAGGDLLPEAERVWVGADVDRSDDTDEGAQDGLPTAGAELGPGLVAVRLGKVEPWRRLLGGGHVTTRAVSGPVTR